HSLVHLLARHAFPTRRSSDLCRTCEVQGACLAWALQVGDCHGVWGATTPRERRAMLVAWHSDEVQQQLAESASDVRAAERPPRRSEEHTSELQSREKLVCRLL